MLLDMFMELYHLQQVIVLDGEWGTSLPQLIQGGQPARVGMRGGCIRMDRGGA